ncbi:hypothetical protein [Caballeronia zhejiangensis]|uniref:hypothetical protein n=1 Tax=Caballeronia zhejiangensis TaxID=871203 RepID=UPI001589E245|nr:hypothetical protein [Caballeronia zhejiangensis]
MKDEEALAKVDGAIKAAQNRVGNDQTLLQKDLKQQRAADPSLFEAFKRTGQLMQQTQQGH